VKLIGFFAVAVVLVGCVPTARAQDLAAVHSDLAAVQSEAKAAQTDDARYTGGLIKTLIATRIAILRQTEAMLEQKLESLKLGIPVRYAVDGKAFSLPASASQMLADVESEISASEVKMHQQEAEAARYSGGLVHAMSLTALETMRQTHAMLEQKRLSLKYGLPQYIGFVDAKNNGSPLVASAKVPVTDVSPSKGSQQAFSDELRKIITFAVMEKALIPADPQSRRYQALLTLKCSYQNASERDIRAFTGTVIFQDLFGKEIYRASVTISDPIKAGQQATWNGTVNYNQFVEAQQRFRAAELRDMQVVWVLASIIFADGTRIGERPERN
jgi:hypothetical protein